MGYMLREGLSFCQVENRLLFLDLPADRYFCLTPATGHAVTQLWREQSVDASDQPSITRLVGAGLLVEGDGVTPIAPCPAPPVATGSLLGTGPAPGTTEIAAALLHLTRCEIELRTIGLAPAVARAARRKCRIRLRAGAERIATTASAFEACNTLVSPHDRCLPRSLAIAHRLMGVGARPDIVLAVKLGPFKAHAWVQCGAMLVNERVEVTRLFTPILVL